MVFGNSIRVHTLTMLAVCFLALGVGQSTRAQTADLFYPYPQADGAHSLPPVDPHVVLRQHFVGVRFEQFFTEDGYADVLSLNPFDDVSLTAIRGNAESASSGGVAWYGYIQGLEGSQVTLVVEGQRLSATIELQERLYHIRHLHGDVHVARELDRSLLPGSSNASSLATTFDVQTETRGVLAADADFESEVLRLVNQERAVAGIVGVEVNGKLRSAAFGHAQDMSEHRYFSHTSLDGRGPGERISDAGYSWNTYGENIAYGYSTPEAVMNAWMNSPGHRSNILRESFCDLGVGFVSEGNFWVQDFGRAQGVSVCDAGTPVQESDPLEEPPRDPAEDSTDPSSAGELENGVAQGFSLSNDETVMYTIQVSANTQRLLVYTTGSGNADLYLKRSNPIQWPEEQGRHNSSEFKAPNGPTSREAVYLWRPRAGTWYLFIHARTAADGRLRAFWR